MSDRIEQKALLMYFISWLNSPEHSPLHVVDDDGLLPDVELTMGAVEEFFAVQEGRFDEYFKDLEKRGTAYARNEDFRRQVGKVLSYAAQPAEAS